MAKVPPAAPATQLFENPTVLIRYDPENAPLVLADNATKMLARVQGAKPITSPKQLETVSELINDALVTSSEIETFIGSLREGIQRACERVREIRGYEDFEATLTVRTWGLRQLLNQGITALKNGRGRYLADEQEKARQAQAKIDAEQRRINEENARKQAELAKKAGADRETVKAIKEEVLATPAPLAQSRPIEQARAAGNTIRWKYTAKVTDLRAFLHTCLDNPVFFNTLKAAAELDIQDAFNKMAADQKESFKYPGITFEKQPVDVSRKVAF